NGASDIASAGMLVNSALTAANGCLVFFARASNQFFLVNDAGTAFLGPVTAGSNASLQNSSCVFDASTSGSATVGTVLTGTAALRFKPAFAGSKNNYMLANDSVNQSSGWIMRGTFVAQ